MHQMFLSVSYLLIKFLQAVSCNLLAHIMDQVLRSVFINLANDLLTIDLLKAQYCELVIEEYYLLSNIQRFIQ